MSLSEENQVVSPHEQRLNLSKDAEKAYLDACQMGKDFNVREFKILEANKRKKFFLAPDQNKSPHNKSKKAKSEQSDSLTANRVPGSETSDEVTREQRSKKNTASDAAASILQEMGIDSTEQDQLKLDPNLAENIQEKGGDDRQEISKSRKKKKGKTPEQDQSKPAKKVKKKKEPFGFMEKLAILGMFSILAVAALAIIGGSLNILDWSVFRQMLGGYRHPFEFVGNVHSRQVQNKFNRQPFYIFEGKLKNLHSDSDQIKSIHLKALAYDNNQQLLSSHITYAGLMLTDLELKRLSPTEITTLRQTGDFSVLTSNINVDSHLFDRNLVFSENQEIPFQAIFLDTESAVENVSFQIVSYLKKDKLTLVRAPEDKN